MKKMKIHCRKTGKEEKLPKFTHSSGENLWPYLLDGREIQWAASNDDETEDICFVETETELENELGYWSKRVSLEEAWRETEKNLLPQQEFLRECYKNWWDDQYFERPKIEKLETLLRIYRATLGMHLLGELAGMDLLDDEQDLISCTVRDRDFSGLDLSSNKLLRGIVFIDCSFANCNLVEEFCGENMFYRCDFTGAETLAAPVRAKEHPADETKK